MGHAALSKTPRSAGISRCELALRRHIIDQSGRGYVTYENLDLRYGAAHRV